MYNKLERLLQVLKLNAATYTTEFRIYQGMPRDRKSTYVQAICDIQPQKTKTHQTRLTTGGSILDYPGEVSTSKVDLTTVQMYGNSVTSNIISRYMCIDVKDFLPKQLHGPSRICHDPHVHNTQIINN